MILPEEFVKRMKEMLGDEADAFLDTYNEEHYQSLRFNPLKVTDLSAAAEGMKERFGLRQVPWCPSGYYYEGDTRPGRHPYHFAGVYYIQEPSAMAVGELACVKPGERVLDLCAAPGGKTSHLAGQMMNRGLLWANEIVPGRATILSQNVERMAITNAVVSNESPDRLASRLSAFFTTVVVDTPCSGEGMFRRDEIARTEWSPDNVKMCSERGRDILDSADRMLMRGGKLVYSTCTFAPDEDEKAVCAFLSEHPEYHVEKVNIEPVKAADKADGWLSKAVNAWGDGEHDVTDTFRLWPHRLHGEGHYVAVLRKGSEEELAIVSSDRKKNDKGKDAKIKEAIDLYKSFAKDFLTDKGGELLCDEPERYRLFGDNLYLIPQGMPDIKGLKIERGGLHLGEIKKNRFEPGHAYALALSPDMVKVNADIASESDDCLKYLKGESISCDPSLRGWCLVSTDGYSLGLGKAVNGNLKNHYPKGLRIKA